MTAAAFITVLASCSGIAMSLMPLTQVRRLLLVRRSDEIAIELFAFAIFGSSVWLAYGMSNGDTVLWVANAVGLATNSAVVLSSLRFRRAPATEVLSHD